VPEELGQSGGQGCRWRALEEGGWLRASKEGAAPRGERRSVGDLSPTHDIQKWGHMGSGGEGRVRIVVVT
jgi:hypothetical protein